jgi:SpoVK/Ycf46/Vps4 family AAA+-type ATPase
MPHPVASRGPSVFGGYSAPQSAPLSPGLADVRDLPDESFLALWDAILVDPALKDRLLSQAVLNFTVRPRVSRATLPLHGIMLLVGPPGTGKTSLAKGLAARTAQALKALGRFRFLEVDPHALSSGSLGKSQRAVTELFGSAIAEHAMQGPTVVLLDEVETILADRSKLSLEANPVDVHRATDAALVQLDHLAETHPNVLFIATSNFPRAIDDAFISRADLVITIPPPDRVARLSILRDTLGGMSASFSELRALADSPDLADVAKSAEGLDGRAMRKLVASACALDKRTALLPGTLTLAQLKQAAVDATRERSRVRGDAQDTRSGT